MTDQQDTLRRRAEDLRAKLAATDDKLEAAETDLEQAQAAYRATTDGLARSLRAIERAMSNPESTPKERKRLTQLHINAEMAAATEYAERTENWGHRPGDGHLFACPMGGSRRLNSLLTAVDLLGTYRVDPVLVAAGTPQDSFVVRLAMPVSGQMRRTRATVPASLRAGEDLTLLSVLRYAIDDPSQVDKIDRFLGPDLSEHLRRRLPPATP